MSGVDDYLEGGMDGDDIFPCKGCGEILEEGKAFELAGHRWHLNCFRCNTCGTLLDSDANLLLLGDGSLICNNCTYSCSACGNKIEDLAILTGDQAFCATCFRCRNCKRKIENLRYARTSQGIFCMNCHESLMSRRRKKHKAAAQAKAREKDNSPMITEKSLPALPPSAVAGADAPTELSPRPPPPRPSYARNDSSRSGTRPDRSPERSGSDATRDGGVTLSPPTYRNNRNSTMLGAPSIDLAAGDNESFFIPVALDPSPAPTQTSRPVLDGLAASALDRKGESQAPTPHIAFQEKVQAASPSDYESSSGATSRDHSRDHPRDAPTRRLSKSSRSEKSLASTTASVDVDPKKLSNGRVDEFKLQDAPKNKRAAASMRSNSQSSVAFENGSSKTRKDKDKSSASPPTSVSASSSAGRSSQDTRRHQEDDDGRQSLDSGAQFAGSRPSISDQHVRTGGIARKELPPSARPVNGKGITNPLSELTSPTVTPPTQPRLNPTDTKMSDTYMQPRAPPQPPQPSQPAHAAAVHTPSREANDHTPGSTPTGPSPKLPRWSSGGDFSMDEDMARILGTDEGSSSLLRRVSNAVRHGRNSSTESGNYSHHGNGRPGHNRSLSETTRATASPRWPKTPIVEDSSDHGHDISSPISLAGGAGQEDAAFLKRQLRNSEQRVAELERQFGAEKDLKSLNKKLLEKRRTVSVLDTQTEIMIRQLEVLAGYVERAKATKQPIDAKDLEDSAIKDFVQRLNELQKTMSVTIEQLHAERNQLFEEKNQAIADRDRALLEFEQLSSKNAQLAEMNNDLTHQIQERFKSHITAEHVKSPAAGSGLGIYHPNKGPSISSMNMDNASIQTSGGVTLVGTDVDESIVESGPTVVNIRKGQVRKFNWKKGSKTVAQNFSKGVNRAVGAFQNERDQRGAAYGGLGGDNIGLPYNMTVTSVDSPAAFNGATGPPNARTPDVTAGMGNRNASGQMSATVASASAVYAGGGAGANAAGGGGFGFFKKSTLPRSGTAPAVAMASAAVAPEPPSTLFGSDLVERADHERRQIPSVVTRCIEEVELRGMDVEGIYRKTGGNSQVKSIREGFEKMEDYDISDPALDITAVTSVLKQYFRKLPDPLLTFEVYDRILESNFVTESEERCAHLRKTINMLPQKHRDCLEFLMFHLARVANRERENLMSPKNLAVVFAPTIMRDLSVEREMTDMHSKNTAVQFIIENSNVIFSEA